MLKLWEHPFSPYVQKVKIALYEKGIRFETEVPDAFSGAPTAYSEINPRIEVPTLVDDGFRIFDSTIILDYIEDKWPKPQLLPSEPHERARVRMIEELCDTYYEAINWGLMEVQAWKRASGELAKRLTERAGEQTAGVYRWLERELGGRGYFNGATFGHGDLSVYPYVHGSAVWGMAPEASSPLGQWLGRVEPRESIRQTIEATMQFGASMDTLPQILASGAFARQYRDHRLEWMVRSGGMEIVVEGLQKKTVRFGREIE